MSTNMGLTIWVSKTPQPEVVDLTVVEAITDWEQITLVSETGESGTNTNILSLPVMDTEFTQKGKGISDAGDFTITCKRKLNDPGQMQLTALAKTPMNYVIKRVWNDQLTTAGVGTTVYDRGIIAGPLLSGGGPEEFVTNTWTCGFQQGSIIVPAT